MSDNKVLVEKIEALAWQLDNIKSGQEKIDFCFRIASFSTKPQSDLGYLFEELKARNDENMEILATIKTVTIPEILLNIK